MKTITVLGNNSGRNAGDNAILGNLLDDFALEHSDILFQVPTLNTRFIQQRIRQFQAVLIAAREGGE